MGEQKNPGLKMEAAPREAAAHSRGGESSSPQTFDWLAHYDSWVKPDIDNGGYRCLADLLSESCKRYADKPAFSCLGRTFTFREWEEAASQFASYLQKHVGLKKGDRLAIMLPNTPQFPIAFYAAQKIGVICVNTNPLYTPREMQHQFKDSGAVAILIADLFLKNLEQCLSQTDIKTVISTGLGDTLPTLKRVLVSTVLKAKGMVPKHSLRVTTFPQALRLGGEKPYDPASIDLNDTAVLQYTGGTTGVSKGAELTQSNLLCQIEQIRNLVGEYLQEGEETVLTALPLYHIFALTVNFIAFMRMGQHSVLLPKPVPIKNTIKAFEKYPISVMTGVNTLFNALNNDPAFTQEKTKHLKLALGGGMAVQNSVSDAFKKITGIAICQAYGLTETSPGVTVNPLGSGGKQGSIGIPLPSTEVKIVDKEGKELPIGESGELVVRGPQVMKGYWNRPEETKKSLKEGWFFTGDMAKRDEDGYFYIVDRKKDMVLVSGFNVFPNEVEEVLAAHDKVLEAAVIGVPDDKSGEVVKAFIVKKDASLTEDELRAYCEENLTNYKRPRYYEFRSELPKTNVGKILRRKLREE